MVNRPLRQMSAPLRAVPTEVVHEDAGPRLRSALGSDRIIVAGLLRGEAWATERLFVRVHGVLDRTLLRVARTDGPVHEALVERSFGQVVEKLWSAHAQAGHDLPSWAAAIAVDVALEHLRQVHGNPRLLSRFRRRSHAQGACPSSGRASCLQPDPTDPEPHHVQVLLARLRHFHAHVLIMRDLLGYGPDVVARVLGLPLAEVERRLSQARQGYLRLSAGVEP